VGIIFIKLNNQKGNDLMLSKKNILTAVGIMLLAAVSYGADKYQIDPVHSSIGFSVKHLVISNVKGTFTDFSGAIMYDSTDITKSSADVTIKMATINTGNPDRDKHLMSPDFFDAEKYPDITFKSSKIEKKGDALVMTGMMTMHGISKEIAVPFNINGTIKDPMGKFRMGSEASFIINRQDYGVSFSKTLETGGLVVGNDVKIDLSIEAVKQ